MRQFGCDQGAITLTDELSTSNALVVVTRFKGNNVSQTLTVQEKFFWPGLARVGLRSRHIVLVEVFGLTEQVF